eukprot:SAG22_NODE_56_length_23716_cov_11.146759_12_plen_86_part_00
MAAYVSMRGLSRTPVITCVANDYLTLPDGSRHYKADCPAGVMLAAGQSLAWHSSNFWQGNTNRDDENGLPPSRSGLGGGWQDGFA